MCLKRAGMAHYDYALGMTQQEVGDMERYVKKKIFMVNPLHFSDKAYIMELLKEVRR